MRKFSLYILIFAILVGLFSPIGQVNAVDEPEKTPAEVNEFDEAIKEIEAAKAKEEAEKKTEAEFVEPQQENTRSAFRQEVDKGCSVFKKNFIGRCIVLVVYYTYFQVPSWILWISAWFFNAMVNLGIDSKVTSASDFIPDAWAVVRDLSNIFFILILLYIAIQTILGIGHETKKMIVYVIIMALLINFSMFFTKVIIDSSNILALVFYNKLEVNPERQRDKSRPEDEKDISGEIWKTFDATQLITPGVIEQLKKTTVEGEIKVEESIPVSITLGIILVAGSIMLWTAYALFMTGVMFIGRLIELWILIIFSPFAFMSWTVPKFAGIEYLGWDAWFKRLISTSFMAPIFMFFLYLILQILPSISKIKRGDDLTIVGTLLNILIPAIIVIAMLLKAAHFAKKGGGQFGELVLKSAQMMGGLALGAATGGAGMLATSTVGKLAMNAANNSETRRLAAGGEGITAKQQKSAQSKLARANYFANKSFDLRETGFGKFVAGKTGMDFNKGTGMLRLDTKKLEGGAKGRDKREAEKQEEKIESYKMTKREAEEQDKLAGKSSEQNARASQYKQDEKAAEKNADEKRVNFDKEAFKKAYIAGGDLNKFNIDKKVDGGSVEEVEKVKTSAQINQDRRTAYANSLDEKNEMAKDAMGTFWNEFKKGGSAAMKSMVTTPIGLAATLATAGVGIPFAGLARGITQGITQGTRSGIANIIKDSTAEKSSFLKALKETLRPYTTNPELVAGLRKEDSLKELKKLLKKEHKSEHDEEKIAKGVSKEAGLDHGQSGGTTSHPPGGEHH